MNGQKYLGYLNSLTWSLMLSVSIITLNVYHMCMYWLKKFHIICLSTIILSIVAIWIYNFKIVVKLNKWLSVFESVFESVLKVFLKSAGEKEILV